MPGPALTQLRQAKGKGCAMAPASKGTGEGEGWWSLLSSLLRWQIRRSGRPWVDLFGGRGERGARKDTAEHEDQIRLGQSRQLYTPVTLTQLWSEFSASTNFIPPKASSGGSSAVRLSPFPFPPLSRNSSPLL